jgi:hypothetical protein
VAVGTETWKYEKLAMGLPYLLIKALIHLVKWDHDSMTAGEEKMTI